MSDNIPTRYKTLLRAREFTYVVVYGTRNQEFDKFVIWIAKPHEQVLRRKNAFMKRVYGRILESSVYPRTYIREATSLVRLGLHEEGSTADIHAFFSHWGKLTARMDRQRCKAQAQNVAGIERERQNPVIDYSGTYIGSEQEGVTMWKDRRGSLHPAPDWMQKFQPGQMFLNGQPITAIQRRRDFGDIEAHARRAPTVYEITNVLTNARFCIRLLRKGEAYGLDWQLIYDEDTPLLEFYDSRPSTVRAPLGLLLERHYATPFLKRTRPLDIFGQRISSKNIEDLKDWLKSELETVWVPPPPPPRPTSQIIALTPANLVQAGERRVTLYVKGGFGRRKIEAHWFKVYRRPSAQYANAFFVEYKPRGNRGVFRLEETSPSLVVLLGWEHPEFQEVFQKTSSVGGFMVSTSRYASCDKRWEDEFESQLSFYLATTPLTHVLVDLRGQTVQEHAQVAPQLLQQQTVFRVDGTHPGPESTTPSIIQSHPRVFISYFHREDSLERDRFEDEFGAVIESASIYPGEIEKISKRDSIRQVIRTRIGNCEHVIVLIGMRTFTRKWVDWEIHSALDERLTGRAKPVTAVLVPSLAPKLQSINELLKGPWEISSADIQRTSVFASEHMLRSLGFTFPLRLLDNLLSGYARVISWPNNSSEFVENLMRDGAPFAVPQNDRKLMRTDLTSS